MPRKPIPIKSDGKSYMFTPGSQGSLISTGQTDPSSFELLSKAVAAKSMATPQATEAANNFQLKKKREGISKILVGSVRG